MPEPHDSGYLIAPEHVRRDWIDYPDAAGDLMAIETEVPDTATVCHLVRIGDTRPLCGSDVPVHVLELLCWEDLESQPIRCERCNVWVRAG